MRTIGRLVVRIEPWLYASGYHVLRIKCVNNGTEYGYEAPYATDDLVSNFDQYIEYTARALKAMMRAEGQQQTSQEGIPGVVREP